MSIETTNAILQAMTMLDDIHDPQTTPVVLSDGFGFTEGPAADALGRVYFSDGQHDAIHVWSSGKPIARFTDDSIDPIGMMFNTRGELYVCEGAVGRVVAYDIPSKKKRILCDRFEDLRFNEPNDLAVDRTDGFYFSDPNYQHHGQPTVRKQDVYYCTAEGKIARVSTIAFKPNGVLLSGDDRTLYLADARGQRIYRYDVPAPGQLCNERIWIDQLDANPDGMTLDEYDNLYICCGRVGLKIFDAKGSLLGQLALHAANCCFGGPDFRTLLIASADKFLGMPMHVAGLKPLCLRS